jgi:5-(carboxyamino)imidazole ribonucleotide mutase
LVELVRFVELVELIVFVSQVQPNQPNQLNKPNQHFHPTAEGRKCLMKGDFHSQLSLNFGHLKNLLFMQAKVSIIMGSTSDMPVMQEAAKILDQFKIPFEINALSAHRVPEQVVEFAKNAHKRGIRVIIAGAGGAAHLPGVVAALTPMPVVGVPCRSTISIDGWDSLLSIVQMPPGIPVATVGLDGGQNAGILAVQILAAGDDQLLEDVLKFKETLKSKILKANEELKTHKFQFRVDK